MQAALSTLPELRLSLGDRRRRLMAEAELRRATEADRDRLLAELALANESNRQLSALVASSRGQLADARQSLERLQAERTRLDERADVTAEALTKSQERLIEAAQEQQALEASLTRRRADGEALDEDRDRLARRVAELETLIADMRDRQRDIVDRLELRTIDTVASLEKVISTAGLDVEALLAEAGAAESGQGGPFIPADEMLASDVAYELQVSVALLDNRLDRWDALQRLAEALPLRPPLKTYRLTSDYGYRRDPVNGRRSFHNGIDLATNYKTPLTAGGAGVVVFAGWRGGYGRVIEIDHGFGIKSRYAHLAKIGVKKGDRVTEDQTIGLVGSSGRATGPHVHYEILYHDANYDPMNFIRAGRYVQ